MRIGALVPARMGSRRLPRKNIRLLGSKPLICWTLDVLLEADIFGDITVSTENETIREVVRDLYSEKEVQVRMRPHELATDDAPLSAVVRHYLKNTPDIDWLGLFMPTFPFRNPEKLREAHSAILSFYPWRVVSITTEEDCSMDFYYPSGNGVKNFFRHQPFYASYNLPVYSMHNVHVPDELWGKYGLAISERTLKIHLEAKECVDVDTEEDFAIARQIAEGGMIRHIQTKQIETEKWRIIMPKAVDPGALVAFAGERLKDACSPLLVLEPARPALSFYRYFDGNIRTYWINHEAHEYLSCEQYKKTENSQNCPLHFRHSKLYRFIRKTDEPSCMNPQLTDEKGILCLSGVGRGEDSIVSDDRIIHLGDLNRAGFPTDRFSIMK